MNSSMSIESTMQAVHDAALLAGRVAFSRYRTGTAVDWKDDGSPVTAADRSAEEAVRAWIQERFPADGILGEEFGEQPGTSGRCWLVDPVDGTRAFVRGVPLWGSLVAVVEGERVIAGAASFPAVGETVTAATGCGAWWNGTRASVSDVADIGAATILVTDDRRIGPPISRDAWQALARRAADSRGWGDCFGYLLVATGRAEMMLDPIVNPWDVACFLPIIEEAGGVFTDLNGVTTAFGGHSIATNRALATELRDLLR